MDVTCEKCRAEYEFDETLLGERGATVKCSSCQHVFRVKAPERPMRGALKLRFARSGQVETIGSLRALQQRIAQGEIGADDELGRDGFAFRRLGDVPELKNFFTLIPGPQHAGAPTKAPTPLSVNETSMPPSSKNDSRAGAPPQAAAKAPDPAKRTMLGVGPLNPHIPPPPRVPNVPGALPAPARTLNSEPARPRGAPISSIPTAPQAATPSPEAARAAPVSGVPTAPNARAPRLPSDAPPIARPPGETPRTLDSANIGTPGMKLYLADDESPPARATASSSRAWLYALLVVALGGAGWLGMNALSATGGGSSAPAASAASPASEPTTPGEPADPGPATQPMAGAPTGTDTPESAAEPAPKHDNAGQAPGAKSKASEPAPSAAKAEKQTAKPEKEPAKVERQPAKEARAAEPEPRETASRDPSDYNGWVLRGDQLFARGDMQGARTAYETALALRPSGSEANTGLGFTLLASNRTREAIPHFDRAAHSGYAEASIGLGDAYRKLGQKSSAIEAYESYLERLPTGSKAQYARSQVLNLKGSRDSEQAREPAAPTPGEEYRPAGELGPAPAAPSEESEENEL